MIRALAPFAPLFSKSVWQHVQVLVAGTILAPGRRTVSSALRAMGMDQYKQFPSLPSGSKPRQIRAKGVYRDPVRSSHHRFVKVRALRWICVMLLAHVPWTKRVGALPFLSALAYSELYARERGLRHKPLTEWAWQMLVLVRRWYPDREVVAVSDRQYASLKLLDRCRKLSNPITFVTRLRLDAALYEPAPPRRVDRKSTRL